VLCIVALACVPVAAWQTPVRDSPAAPVFGTATLAGVVITDDADRRPVRRAVMTLNASDGTVGRTTITDDAGRFEFSSLPAGRFSLVATKAGYVTAYYRSQRPGRSPAVPIPLTNGQQLVDVRMAMIHGAAITGRLLDPSGRPAALAQVSASLLQIINGERGLSQQFFKSAYTDERGVYRIYGLVPGDYVVTAVSMQSPRLAADVRAANPGDIQRAQLAVREASARVAPMAPVVPVVAPEVQMLGYAPVFFPGTTDFSSAVAVTVGAGEERADVDFPMSMVPMVTVDGILRGPDGQPVERAMVTLVWFVTTMGSSMSGVQSAPTTGAFSFSSVAPGQYTILARGPNPQEGASSLWASAELGIDGHNIHDVVLTLQPGVTLAGRVVIQAASNRPPDLTHVQVSLESALMSASSTLGVSPVLADASGAFTFTGLMPGKYRLTAKVVSAGSAATWTLKSSVVAGRDVSELPVEIRLGDDVSNAIVTLSDRVAELSGVLRDATGSPSTDYSVVVFSADNQYWTRGSRRVRGPIRPGSDGTFIVSDLPPGDYFLAAVTDLDASELSDATVLREIAAKAIRVTLGEGEKKKQDLQVTAR
jgi:hypothetical protein